MPPPVESAIALKEGAKCKAALRAFTESVIERLGVPPDEADQLRKHDGSRKHGNVYLHFPFCFREVFPSVALEHLRSLALSGALWMSYMRTQDDMIDQVGTVDANLLFLRDLYLRHSLHILYQLFPFDSVFWQYYSRYFDEYACAVLREKTRHSSINSTYDDEEEFHSIAKGKAAMAKYPMAAEAVLSDREEKLHLLAESLDCFYVGYQYWDDLVDWKEDLANSKYSLLLTKALEHLTIGERTLPVDPLRQKLARVVHLSGLADEQLDRSFEWFERAYELSSAAGATIWSAHVRTLQCQTVALKADLRSIRSRS